VAGKRRKKPGADAVELDAKAALGALPLWGDPAVSYRDEANVITHQTFRLVLEDFHQWLSDDDMKAITIEASALLAAWLARRDIDAKDPQGYIDMLEVLRTVYTADWETQAQSWPADPGEPCRGCRYKLRGSWTFCPCCGRARPGLPR
jgi:hypothetical protein